MNEPQQSSECVALDELAPADAYQRAAHDIARSTARARNWLACVLVIALAGAPVIHIAALWIFFRLCGSAAHDSRVTVSDLQAIFDAWYPIMSPLAGAGIGYYFGVQTARAAREPR